MSKLLILYTLFFNCFNLLKTFISPTSKFLAASRDRWYHFDITYIIAWIKLFIRVSTSCMNLKARQCGTKSRPVAKSWTRYEFLFFVAKKNYICKISINASFSIEKKTFYMMSKLHPTARRGGMKSWPSN